MQMLERTDGRFLLVLVRLFMVYADVLDQKLERKLLSDFNGALDLIHGRDAMQLLRRRNVEGRRAAASPFFVRVHGRVQRVDANSGAAEPVADFANVLLFGVVEVPARSEDLDGFRATSDELVQQAGMQPLASRVHQG